MNLEKCDFRSATHVKFNDKILEINEKWGIKNGKTLAPPSEGGFGCTTVDGQRITMWQASGYFKRG